MRHLHSFMAIDEKDLKILDVLKENAKLSTYKLAKKTLIPVATVHNRIKKLEKEGIITQYTIKTDHKKLGRIVTAYVLIRYDISSWGKTISREQFKKRLLCLSDIEEIKYITGRFDILLKGYFKDLEEVDSLLLNELRKIPGVGQTETFLVVETVK